MNLNPIKVILHERDEPVHRDGHTLSMRFDDSTTFLLGQTIGEINVEFKGWMAKDLEVALSVSSATMRFLICEEFLKLDEFKMWEGHEDRVKIGMADRCIYLFVTKPDGQKIDLRPGDFPSMCDRINAAQSLFEIRDGKITHGSPEGGTLQFMYKLKEEK